ncbi:MULTISPECIES: anti-sigma factor domain-containing protein [Clostridium]|uniref:Anti-sigma factor domain-containing protein n=1 Tax=Clostridium cibarium TaxID=2762247 RepID=A0ABR8PUS8_9CLOT|nr:MULTISPECIES: anti-sigma factor domain-containing protein [Clostridium]MBD7911925.1 anti-sigma factor domain-containing protein [Clostridium cibarium]
MGEFSRNKYIFSGESAVLDIGEKVINLREKQISLMIKELFLFKVFMKDLVSHFPSYKDRNLILNIAYYIIEDVELFEKFMERRELSFSKLAKATQVSRGFIEIWQDYIIAYVIIFSNPNYKYIQEALKVEVSSEFDRAIPLDNKKNDIRRGIVIKIQKRSKIIMTGSGQFVKIKNLESVRVGGKAEGREKKGVAHFKFHLALAGVLLMLLAFAIYKDYNHVSSTIVVTGTSQVKLEINKGNKVIYTHSEADKGKDLIDSVNPMDKKIDIVLRDCIEYAKNNDMIPKDGILVTITGRPLKYGELEETGEYVLDKKISIKVNNVGNFQNINEITALKRKEEDKK